MKYEESVLTDVTEARTAWSKATSAQDKMASSDLLSGALKSLFAVAENYPNLKANSNFMQLQNRISGIENEIADRREFYNETVNNFNIRIQQIPDVFVARILNYQSREFWKASEEERKDIKVQF